MMRTARHWRVILSLVAVVSCAGFVRAENAEVTSSEPKIAEVRAGFAGKCKVGYWVPVWVDVSGGGAGGDLTVSVTTADSDGVDANVSAAVSVESKSADGLSPTLLYTKLGNISGSVRVELINKDEKVLDRRDLTPLSRSEQQSEKFTALASTSEFVVQLGSGSLGLTEAYPDRDAAEGALARHTVQLTDVNALPTDWFGYEGVDLLVVSTSDLEFCRRLASDERRFAALEKWINLGGRLVLCSARNASELFAKDGVWTNLLPGQFESLVRLSETRVLENFAETNKPIRSSVGSSDINVMRLTGVKGYVELFGRDDLPLIVRTSRGFGELTFVGLDLDAEPLASWEGRKPFLRTVLRPYLAADDVDTSRRTLVSLGYNDLVGALRQSIGSSFTGVIAIGFPIVAALVIAYLLLLGPIDFLIVHRLAGRPWVAWVTFALLVVATCAAAIWGLHRTKQNVSVVVNQIELVDIDMTNNQARGTFWASLYSADARRFDLALVPHWPGGQSVDGAEQLISWLGSPGTGLGGMNASGARPSVMRASYRWSPQLGALHELPVLTSSTKSLFTRWQAPVTRPPITADLNANEDGLVVGTLTSAVSLQSACLLYGSWGYRLGDIKPGVPLQIGPQLSALQVRTLLSSRVRSNSGAVSDHSVREGFSTEEAASPELLEVMMFYEALGGYSFAGLLNRYQSYCDLSRMLVFDRAILVGRGTAGGSGLVDVDTGKPLTSNGDTSPVLYRFILPVKK